MEEGYKPCPYCAEPIREAATICRYCNRNLKARASPETADAPAPRRLLAGFDRWRKAAVYSVIICGLALLLALGYLFPGSPLANLWDKYVAGTYNGPIFASAGRSSSAANGPPVGSPNSTSTLAIVPPAPVFQSARKVLVAGNFVLQPGRYSSWTFTVDPASMSGARLVGSFHTFGGRGNDIAAVLAVPDEFENWINGHQAQAFYSTGKITNGQINVGPLPAGTFILAFSNTFSAFATKQVTAYIELRYMARAQ